MEAENQKDGNPQKVEEKKDVENYNFVYFIVSYQKNKKFTIYLSDAYEGKNSLEKLKEQETKNELNELHNEVYRFKIIIGALKKDEDQKYHILIFADDAEGKKHQYDIKFTDETKDFYEYDFKVEEIDFQLLSHEEQFEIYLELLTKTLKINQSTPVYGNFILCEIILLLFQ